MKSLVGGGYVHEPSEVCSCKIYVGPRMDGAKHTQGGTHFVPITGKLQRRYCRVHLSNWSPTTQASLVCELSSRPNTSYVAQHTPTSNSTLPPKGVCKHHQAVFSLTSTNGCHEAKILSTIEPTFESHVPDTSPVLWGNHADKCAFLLCVWHGTIERKQEKFLAARQQRI